MRQERRSWQVEVFDGSSSENLLYELFAVPIFEFCNDCGWGSAGCNRTCLANSVPKIARPSKTVLMVGSGA